MSTSSSGNYSRTWISTPASSTRRWGLRPTSSRCWLRFRGPWDGQAMGFTPDQFTVLFAIPRTVGWLAQWQELLGDADQKIARPRQIYIGQDARDFVPVAQRGKLQTVTA